MSIVRAVFERGIEARLLEGRWVLSSGADAAPTFGSLAEVQAALPPWRVILVTDARDSGRSTTLLLRPGTNDYFGTAASGITNRILSLEAIFPAHDLAYLLGAIAYHCQQLAERYAEIAVQYMRLTQLSGALKNSDHGLLGRQVEPYFEFEALISAARRAYDSCRYLLWPKYGPARASLPRSLEKVLAQRSAIPPALHKRLGESWQNVGLLLTQYRDCIHHYVPVDFSLASASMEMNSLNTWTSTIRIPDNPDARSKRSFTFSTNRDALTYAWDVAEEILEVSLAVIEAVEPRKPDA